MSIFISTITNQTFEADNKQDALIYFQIDNPETELFDIKYKIIINNPIKVETPETEEIQENKPKNKKGKTA